MLKWLPTMTISSAPRSERQQQREVLARAMVGIAIPSRPRVFEPLQTRRLTALVRVHDEHRAARQRRVRHAVHVAEDVRANPFSRSASAAAVHPRSAPGSAP